MTNQSPAVIYDVDTLHVYNSYATLSGAKSALTRARKTGSMKYMGSHGYCRLKADRIAKLQVAPVWYFRELVDEEVEVTNLMSGNKVKIRKSDVGSCVDPSTERYWSM